jgi:uncharacterized damage-inducible protein DinB
MNKEIQYLITTLQNTLYGEPWFGRSAFSILEEIDPSLVYIKPKETEHSLIELLYHMITWAGFTLRRLEGDKNDDKTLLEQTDWREIDPVEHTWEKGMEQFKQINEQIVEQLHTKEDSFLKEKADFREYNFRFLMNGLIQHNIYHLGQIAYVNKLLNS